jgi:hypothetical protein
LNKEQRERIDITAFAKDANVEVVTSIRLQLLRESVMWRVLVPLLIGPVLVSLLMLVCDALGAIPRMPAALEGVFGGIVGGVAVTTAIGAGMGWLFKSDDSE